MVELPVEPQRPNLDFSGMFTLIYGEPKIGKSTLASTFPDSLFIATEEGLRFLEVMKVGCPDYKTFQEIVKELRSPESKGRYRTIVIDTVDLLYSATETYVCEQKGISHPSEEEWGKGWMMVREEFQRGMRYLTSEGYGVVFISHAKQIEHNVRGRKVQRIVPTLSNQARRVIMPLVDFIFYLSMDVDDEESGLRRIYCRNTLQFECGTRQEYFPEVVDEISYDGLQEAYTYARKVQEDIKHG